MNKTTPETPKTGQHGDLELKPTVFLIGTATARYGHPTGLQEQFYPNPLPIIEW